MTDKERIVAMVDDFTEKLAEHVDSVRIFVSFPTLDGESDTASYTRGGGNLFAQHGQVSQWMLEQNQYVVEHAKKECR